MPVIETHALGKQFGPTLAVADLTLSVGAGEVFGFLGPNGAGKTTSVKMLLALVDLPDAADRPLRGYSKGMLQRAGLAQAIINDPDLVFLDEPTSGLDPLGRLLVRDIIGELRARGTTVFLNSHLLSEVEATCDRVAFVKQGRVVHELALAGQPASLDIEIRLAPIDSCLLEGLLHFGTNIAQTGNDSLQMRVATESVIPEVVRWIVDRRVRVYAVHARRKSLEAWFVEVIGEDQRPG
ncbi:MAG: ATP-binding cassette domain-containing protein [Luteitalea sp.]|nr:ATP-binding cassette domain-containing protein [Luteitalea sp.]